MNPAGQEVDLSAGHQIVVGNRVDKQIIERENTDKGEQHKEDHDAGIERRLLGEQRKADDQRNQRGKRGDQSGIGPCLYMVADRHRLVHCRLPFFIAAAEKFRGDLLPFRAGQGPGFFRVRPRHVQRHYAGIRRGRHPDAFPDLASPGVQPCPPRDLFAERVVVQILPDGRHKIQRFAQELFRKHGCGVFRDPEGHRAGISFSRLVGYFGLLRLCRCAEDQYAELVRRCSTDQCCFVRVVVFYCDPDSPAALVRCVRCHADHVLQVFGLNEFPSAQLDLVRNVPVEQALVLTADRGKLVPQSAGDIQRHHGQRRISGRRQ